MFRRKAAGFGVALAALVTDPVRPIGAEAFSFDGQAIPSPLQMKVYQAFYVYATSDAAERRYPHPMITEDLMLIPDTSSLGSQAYPSAGIPELQAYRSLQMLVIPQKHFFSLVDPAGFCGYGTDQSPVLSLRRNISGAVLRTITTLRQEHVEAMLPETGVYLLVISNCGNLSSARITGTASVRNPHGYLPATEYHKIGFWGATILIYILLVAFWGALVLKDWSNLLALQKELLVVCLLGVAESIIMLKLYLTWNEQPDFPELLFLFGSVASSWKTCVMIRLALNAGEAVEDLPFWTSTTTAALLVAYAVADFRFRSTLRFRASYSLQFQDVLWNAMPVTLMFAVLLLLSGNALMRRASDMTSSYSPLRAPLFNASVIILGCGGVGAVIALVLQTLDYTCGEDSTMWRLHFLMSDGLPQAVFVPGLCAAMVVWRPTEATKVDSRLQMPPSAPSCEDGEIVGAPLGGDSEAASAPAE